MHAPPKSENGTNVVIQSPHLTLGSYSWKLQDRAKQHKMKYFSPKDTFFNVPSIPITWVLYGYIQLLITYITFPFSSKHKRNIIKRMNTVYIINIFKITLQCTEYDASSNVKDFRINDRNDNFEAFEIKHILWPKNTPGSIHTAFCIIFTCLSNVKGRDKCLEARVPGKANDICRIRAPKCTVHVMTAQKQQSCQVRPSTEDATSCQWIWR